LGENVICHKVQIPIRAVSVANLREHWGTRATRNKKQRAAVASALESMPPYFEKSDAKIEVTFTRYGKRKLDDDNLSSAFKAMRDEVASQIKRDDNTESNVSWKYKQETAKTYWVEIEIKILG
jgi:hypothetical protein